ncbi:MAG: YraN family protein [Candidatus Accumulibacter phosphatis]|jgi:putative endonuclease|uniref:YraN family protein n=1 Tax=Candidatus Accumulibacter phosphatis TaxID=327160 RepID=UPI001A50A4DE|nr:YraN family protein [Candidatus Accumulibacter phosphatis]
MAISWQVSGNDSTTGQARHRVSDGMIAEDLAARFLERQGLRVLARNYRCRGGEVDLICRERRVLVFVEVRLRRNASYGGAAASITARKQGRIVLAAQHYLTMHALGEADCRFDCILLDGLSEAAVEWLRDAFC